ncbi:MAG: pyridoxamine 5'-phosphate oxidase family protein [SAR202 cluster bacterium]|jgi:predicted pyridoxine 5'-phosphate oxidase superfamily flavin-nucleotide-binding protein|nr:pyridoxamine 5'-phosphate oxidase family protein [SAR202 cluster bacterium]MDP6513915.1 pyridoxamine 5'-phosphate oxidase family protein [SAR202 cluster bacterium]MDP6714221.1 pyridoxamine 5'-phosphate oxidase family protein [SAR202 cluster bacterium]
MISINGDMKEKIDSALADRAPCFVGTASKDGKPQISMKGSVLVYDDDTLAYWERAKRSALDNIQDNPQTVIFYRNGPERINWRFHGTATVHESGDIRDNVMSRTVQQELDRDPERQGVAILVKIDEITELSGNVLQSRD